MGEQVMSGLRVEASVPHGGTDEPNALKTWAFRPGGTSLPFINKPRARVYNNAVLQLKKLATLEVHPWQQL